MTIQLLQPYAGASPGIYTYSAAEEARLVGLGLARYYTVGMDGRNPVLSNAEEIANQAMVLEAWMSGAILALIGAAPTRLYLDSTPLWLDLQPVFN